MGSVRLQSNRDLFDFVRKIASGQVFCSVSHQNLITLFRANNGDDRAFEIGLQFCDYAIEIGTIKGDGPERHILVRNLHL